MTYRDEYILSLPKSPLEAISKVIEDTYDDQAKGFEPQFEDYLDLRDLIISLSEHYKFDLLVSLDVDEKEQIVNQIRELHEILLGQVRIQESRNNRRIYATLLGTAFYYEMSDADTNRIQILINELRDLIAAHEGFESAYRSRLLGRLESLQRELHKRVSDLNRLYGLIGEAGVLLGKFGADAKPFVDRIREIVQIAWRSQANAEELPTSAEPALLTTDRDIPSD